MHVRLKAGENNSFHDCRTIFGSTNCRTIFSSADCWITFSSADCRTIFSSADCRTIFGSADCRTIFGSTDCRPEFGSAIIALDSAQPSSQLMYSAQPVVALSRLTLWIRLGRRRNVRLSRLSNCAWLNRSSLFRLSQVGSSRTLWRELFGLALGPTYINGGKRQNKGERSAERGERSEKAGSGSFLPKSCENRTKIEDRLIVVS